MHGKGLIGGATGFAFGVVAATVGVEAALLCLVFAGVGYGLALHGRAAALLLRARAARQLPTLAARPGRPPSKPRAASPSARSDEAAAYGW